MKKIASTLLGLSLALSLSTGPSYAMDDENDLIEDGKAKFRGSVAKIREFDASKLSREKKLQLTELQQQVRRVQAHQSFAVALPELISSVSKAEVALKSLIEHLTVAAEGLGKYIASIGDNTKSTNVENLLGLAHTISEEVFGPTNVTLLKGPVSYSATGGNAVLALSNLGVAQLDVKYHCEYINSRMASAGKNKAGNVKLFVGTDTSGRTKTIFEGSVEEALAQMGGTGVLTIANSDIVISLKDVNLLKDSRDENSDVEPTLLRGSAITTQFPFSMAHTQTPSLSFAVSEPIEEDKSAHLFTFSCAPYGTILEKVASIMNLPGRSPASFKPVLEQIAASIGDEIKATQGDFDSLEMRVAELLEKIETVSK